MCVDENYTLILALVDELGREGMVVYFCPLGE
jgi:hypothetical protein